MRQLVSGLHWINLSFQYFEEVLVLVFELKGEEGQRIHYLREQLLVVVHLLNRECGALAQRGVLLLVLDLLEDEAQRIDHKLHEQDKPLFVQPWLLRLKRLHQEVYDEFLHGPAAQYALGAFDADAHENLECKLQVDRQSLEALQAIQEMSHGLEAKAHDVADLGIRYCQRYLLLLVRCLLPEVRGCCCPLGLHAELIVGKTISLRPRPADETFEVFPLDQLSEDQDDYLTVRQLEQS